MGVNLSATNDDYVARYALPGVPTPLLPADIVNKYFVEQRYNSIIAQEDTDVTNSTVMVDTPLVLPVEGVDSLYRIQIYAPLFGGTTIAGIKCGFTCSTGQSLTDFQFTNKDAKPSSVRIHNNDGSTGSTPLQTGNEPRIQIDGTLLTSGADGHLRFQIAQKVAEATTLRMLFTSYMILTKIDPPV